MNTHQPVLCEYITVLLASAGVLCLSLSPSCSISNQISKYFTEHTAYRKPPVRCDRYIGVPLKVDEQLPSFNLANGTKNRKKGKAKKSKPSCSEETIRVVLPQILNPSKVTTSNSSNQFPFVIGYPLCYQAALPARGALDTAYCCIAWSVCLCVCMSICWSHGCVVQKRLNQSRCRLCG